MKFEIKFLQESANERLYFQFVFQIQKQFLQSAAICDISFYLIRSYMALNLSEFFVFSPNSKTMVNFKQGGLLDVVTE